MKSMYLFEVTQPIGTFYIGKIMSDELLKIAKIETRGESGIQRSLNSQRIQSIAQYCNDPDAIFPTPIILSVRSSDISDSMNPKSDCYLVKSSEFGLYKFGYSEKIEASVLDGQHRLFGIEASKSNVEIPIALAFNLTEEQKAYIFATINGNQKQVDKSLIYDLFELSTGRSPFKTAHYLARLFNSSSDSPFYGRLKMLEKRTSKMQSLSQNSFVSTVIKYLISNNPQQDMINLKNNVQLADNPNYPLRKYFIKEEDEVIYKILNNYFSSVKLVFGKEWHDYSSSILTKSTGFGALIIALKEIIPLGEKKRTLDKCFFEKGLVEFKIILTSQNKKLTSEHFPSNQQQQEKLAKIIKSAFDETYK